MALKSPSRLSDIPEVPVSGTGEGLGWAGECEARGAATVAFHRSISCGRPYHLGGIFFKDKAVKVTVCLHGGAATQHPAHDPDLFPRCVRAGM